MARAWRLRVNDAADLGGSVNLNLRLDTGDTSFVARVYRPSVGADRLALLQEARDRLRAGGVPSAEALPTASGDGWYRYGDRLVELERFIPSTARMNTTERIREGLPVLARCHSLLAALGSSRSTDPTFANYVSATDAVGSVAVAARRIRSWSPTSKEAALADDAERLAEKVGDLEMDARGVSQLVHGDFWDDNVLFDDDGVALVSDLDFAGMRPRVDDLALTLYFTSVDLEDLAQDARACGDSSMRTTPEQIVRCPTGSDRRSQRRWHDSRCGRWPCGLAMLDDEDAARAHLRARRGRDPLGPSDRGACDSPSSRADPLTPLAERASVSPPTRTDRRVWSVRVSTVRGTLQVVVSFERSLSTISHA